MLYIHRLGDLNPKSAEIESTIVVRDLKKQKPNITEEQFQKDFAAFFISDSDSQAISNAISLINPTIDDVKAIFEKNDSLYEPINLKRAIDILKETPDPLFSNLNYAEDIKKWKDQFIKEITQILNVVPTLKKKEDMELYNNRLNVIFQKILRNKEMKFDFNGIINEANTEHINALSTSMENGFLFHLLLEEEINKTKFSIIKNRIPKQEIEQVEKIKQMVNGIKKGVDRAYENNMRMVQMAVILYSYIRMVSGR
jgi:NADH dehydrogenase/NADH:ubiquinone oxidoreductase subunit G